MLAVDTNVLVYAADADSQFHTACRDWPERQRARCRILPAICSTTRTPPFLCVNTASGELALPIFCGSATWHF